MGAAPDGNAFKRLFMPKKFAFHFFFWGFHWALFAIGW
jgi:NADPH oxidase